MENIFETMKKDLMDALLDIRIEGDKSVDKLLKKLASNDEDVWMEALFSAKENYPSIKEKEIDKVVHGFDIESFRDVYFSLKHHHMSPWRFDTEEERMEDEKKEKQAEENKKNDLKYFETLSLIKKVAYMKDAVDCLRSEIGGSCPILEKFLNYSLSNEVSDFIQWVLNSPEILENSQVVDDGSYYSNVILIRFDEISITNSDIKIMNWNDVKTFVRKAIEEGKVISFNIDYKSKREVFSPSPFGFDHFDFDWS